MYLVTGGAGFIGSAMLWELNKQGVTDIIVADNLGESGKWRNLLARQYADYIHRDKLRHWMERGRLPWKLEAVIHLGACSSTTETDADFLMANNFHFSRDLCGLALEQGARFINASSAATYGDGANGFSDTVPLSRLRPLNMYGYSKHLFDLWLERENLLERVASLKFFNVYGPNEYHKGEMRSVAFKLFHEIGNTGSATLFASNRPGLADGEQSRDFVYVKDCVQLIWWLLQESQVNGVLNVGSGQANTFNTLAKAVFAAMNKPAQISYRPMPGHLSASYQNYTCADMAWLEKARYPHKFRSLQEGVGDYIGNYLANSAAYL